MFPYTESLTFGATRNPWNPTRTPGGSSGGSAAAVAAGLAALALGSDGGGSIRIPSSWCGLFGLKPQRDRVSLDPHENAWYGLSVNGPIARSVMDAALFLDATSTVPGPDGEFVAAATRDPGKLRIALSTKVPVPMPVRVGKEQLAAVVEAGALLRDLGHEVVVRDPEYPPLALRELSAPLSARHLRRRGCAGSPGTPGSTHAQPGALGFVLLRPTHGCRSRCGAGADQSDAVDFRRRRHRRHPRHREGPSRIGAYQHRGGMSTLLLVSTAGSVLPDLESDRPARRGRAVGPRRRPSAGGDTTRRPALRRGDAAVARRADRTRTTVGSPPTADLIRARLPAKRPAWWPGSGGCAPLT